MNNDNHYDSHPSWWEQLQGSTRASIVILVSGTIAAGAVGWFVYSLDNIQLACMIALIAGGIIFTVMGGCLIVLMFNLYAKNAEITKQVAYDASTEGCQKALEEFQEFLASDQFQKFLDQEGKAQIQQVLHGLTMEAFIEAAFFATDVGDFEDDTDFAKDAATEVNVTNVNAETNSQLVADSQPQSDFGQFQGKLQMSGQATGLVEWRKAQEAKEQNELAAAAQSESQTLGDTQEFTPKHSGNIEYLLTQELQKQATTKIDTEEIAAELTRQQRREQIATMLQASVEEQAEELGVPTSVLQQALNMCKNVTATHYLMLSQADIIRKLLEPFGKLDEFDSLLEKINDYKEYQNYQQKQAG